MVENSADLNAANGDGRTALHVAACDGHAEVVKGLLEIGADAKLKDKWGATPLQGAIREKRKEVQAILREHGITLKGDGDLEIAVKLCDLAAENRLAETKVKPTTPRSVCRCSNTEPDQCHYMVVLITCTISVHYVVALNLSP